MVVDGRFLDQSFAMVGSVRHFVRVVFICFLVDIFLAVALSAQIVQSI